MLRSGANIPKRQSTERGANERAHLGASRALTKGPWAKEADESLRRRSSESVDLTNSTILNAGRSLT